VSAHTNEGLHQPHQLLQQQVIHNQNQIQPAHNAQVSVNLFLLNQLMKALNHKSLVLATAQAYQALHQAVSSHQAIYQFHYQLIQPVCLQKSLIKPKKKKSLFA